MPERLTRCPVIRPPSPLKRAQQLRPHITTTDGHIAALIDALELDHTVEGRKLLLSMLEQVTSLQGPSSSAGGAAAGLMEVLRAMMQRHGSHLDRHAASKVNILLASPSGLQVKICWRL